MKHRSPRNSGSRDVTSKLDTFIYYNITDSIKMLHLSTEIMLSVLNAYYLQIYYLRHYKNEK